MSDPSNRSGKILLNVGIVIVVLLGAAAGWYFLQYVPAQEAKERARQERLAKQEEERKRKEQEAQNKARYDQLIQEGDGAYAFENWESARGSYTEASRLFPNETYPKSQIALIDEQLAAIAEREARRAAGVVETIDTRTDRFYVIVSSSVDDDLAMDYANVLAGQGEDVKIIAHDDTKHFYYRVALGDYATQEEAEQAIGLYNGMGEGLWVLEY